MRVAGGRLNPLELAREAALVAGLDPSGARVLRAASATTIHLPMAEAVARVEPAGRSGVATRQWRMARFWTSRGAPTTTLVPEANVFEHDDGDVTLWRWLDSVERQPTGREHGQLLRRLHDASCGADLGSLPRLDVVGDTRFFLAQARDHMDDTVWHRLSAEIDARSGSVDGVVAIHGDPHEDNVVRTRHGLVFIDLELAGVGPPAWDVAVLDLQRRRFGKPRGWWTDFLSGYEADPTDQPGYEDLVRIYEIAVVAWAIGAGASNPRIAAEGRRRLETLQGQPHVWRQS